jgi:type IV secretion system protein VirB5
MGMTFFKSTPRKEPLSDTGPGNPYLAAKEEWLERYGNYISRAAQWRAVAFAGLALLGISLFGNIMQARQSSIAPYLVEIDKLGRINNVGRLEQRAAVPRNLIQATISEMITSWRTVTADTELQRQMIARLGNVVAGGAKGVLKQWFESNNPYEIAKSGRLIHVEIKGLPLPVSDTSYRVEWTETVRSHAGALLEQQSYEATVAIQLIPPESEKVIMVNPGGVYITDLAASKVISR